ncbi:MAG TPA: GNAT family N-acetyltransferase [Aggregatilineaceae bacterium]|nr:GNAT family N-acetyltransferase [Aggregatilineaceae bacterium]
MAIIRRLRSEDALHDLIELSSQFFEEYAVHHTEFFEIDQLHEGDIVGYFSRFLDGDDSAAFIAVADGNIVGYITVYIQPQPGYWKIKKVGHITGLMVQKEYRRSGIGSQLLSEATAFCKEKGVKYCTVYTAARNQAALEFYARNGMTPLYDTMIGEIDGSPEGI